MNVGPQVRAQLLKDQAAVGNLKRAFAVRRGTK
jgi:hypothetical protein